MNILVLTSKENFVWHSMQEIIPYLENIWAHSSSEYYKIKIVNLDEVSLADLTKEALLCQHVVLTCFNLKICKVAEFLRFKLNLSIRFIVYVHNMATIAFWPFRKFARPDFFRTEDVFISSCENDIKNVQAVFQNPKTLLSPFFYTNPDLNNLNKNFSDQMKLVFIGRISSQKNLHSLITAYGLLSHKNSQPNLYLFGKEDHLGSPNMGFKDHDYQQQLNKLIERLGLQKNIIFMGHRSRDEINKFLTENSCLCISPSLHSDENFGMAILQSLILGNQVLISDWGGHSDFAKHFTDRVSLMPVIQTADGPSLKPEIIAHYLQQAISTFASDRTPIEKIDYYQMQSQIERNLSLLTPVNKSSPLLYTDLAEDIFNQKLSLFSNQPTQIFTSYKDPLFLKISKFYIGEFSKNQSSD